MAQLNLTLSQDEIQELLMSGQEECFRKLLENCVNRLLRAESEEQLGAKPYERTSERKDSRNGSRERVFTTRIGTIILSVPRHRDVPFKSMLLENYKRSESALIAAMAEMVVNGVSTRKVSRVMEELCGKSFSKTQVSEVCKDFDSEVESFRNRPLTGEYPFLTVDATYLKARQNQRICEKALMIALATNSEGKREIIGFGVYDKESNDTWLDFMEGLKERGLRGVYMITSDAHMGIQNAIAKTFPDSAWQRCQFHFAKNVADKVPKKYQAAVRGELQDMFSKETAEAARKKRDEIIDEYGDIAENAMKCLDEGFDSAMTALSLPNHLRQHYRTSNQIERLNREIKRRTNVIGIFPNEQSVLRLTGEVLIELHEGLQLRKSIFSAESFSKFKKSDAPANLLMIARTQVLQEAA